MCDTDFRARYYDPAINRFISEDPIGLAGGDNIYAYAYDDPIDLADPFGLKPPSPPPPCGDLGVNCPPPDLKKSKLGCAWSSFKENGVADTLDVVTDAVDVVAPEAQYVRLAWGLGLSTASIINSAVHKDYTGLGLGMTSYLKAPLALAADSEKWKLAQLLPGADYLIDGYATYHDFRETFNDYTECVGN